MSKTKEKKWRKKRKALTTWVIILGVFFGGIWWLASLPKKPGVALLPQEMHIHAQLSIVIDGEEVVIPEDVGVTGHLREPLHTHDEPGLLHMHAWPGNPLRERHIRLGTFFELWGEDFTRESILGNRASDEKEIIFLVNGEPNDLFEHYVMSDTDQIQIIYRDRTNNE